MLTEMVVVSFVSCRYGEESLRNLESSGVNSSKMIRERGESYSATKKVLKHTRRRVCERMGREECGKGRRR